MLCLSGIGASAVLSLDFRLGDFIDKSTTGVDKTSLKRAAETETFILVGSCQN